MAAHLGMHRRSFIASLAAFGASGVAGPSTTLAQPSVAKPFRVDVHHHYFPPAMLEAQVAARADGLSPDVRAWTTERSLDIMDKNGIATAIVSTSSGGELRKSLDRDGLRKLARICNEFAARMAADHPGRFGFFTFLPMPDVEGSLAEIQYGLDTLKADGIGMMTSYDTWLGDAAFLPVLEELNRRKAKVFVHPLAPACCTGLVPKVGNATVEYPYDTGRTVLSLLNNGRLAQFRDISWIFCHAGGPIPMLAGRIRNGAKSNKELAQIAPEGVDYELRRLYYEIANSAYAPTLAALTSYVPVPQILFGTDFPYVSVGDNVEGLVKFKLTAAQRAAIERSNAAKLFPRVTARLAAR